MLCLLSHAFLIPHEKTSQQITIMNYLICRESVLWSPMVGLCGNNYETPNFQAKPLHSPATFSVMGWSIQVQNWPLEFSNGIKHYSTLYGVSTPELISCWMFCKNATWRWIEHTCQWHDFTPELQLAIAIMLLLAKKFYQMIWIIF